MKKLFFIPLMLIGTGLFAQGFQLGVKGGVNISNFVHSNFDQTSLVGFHAGGILAFLIGKNFAIQPEVLFSTQGAKINSGTSTDDYKVSYLTVPVLAKYRFNGGFYLEAGPQFGFKLNENVPNSSINSFAKNLDLSVDGGLGWHSNGGFGIGGRYCVGVSKVGNFDATVNNPNYTPNFRNGVAQIFIFFTLFNNHRDH